MKESNLFEKQYGEKKMIYAPTKQYWGLRRLLKRFDQDRCAACANLISSGNRCLDIGCGNGYLIRNLNEKIEMFYGIDIVSSRLIEARKITDTELPSEAQKFKWILGNAGEGLPFKNERFDVVTCVAVMQHVYDLFNLIKEINRLIKKNGEVIIEVPNIAYLPRRFTLLAGRLPVTSTAQNWAEIGWDGGSIHCFTMKKLCWLFESNGFRVIAKTGSGFLAKLRNWWPSLLCADLIIKARKI